MTQDSLTWSPANNNAAVRAMLVHRLKSGQEPDRPVHPYYQPWAQTAQQSSRPHSLDSAKRSSSSSISGTAPPPGCPMHAGGATGNSVSSKESSEKSSLAAKLNPLNKMPILPQSRAPNQKADLPTDRTMSTIPRAKDSAAPGASPYDKATACPVPHEGRQAMAGGGSGTTATKEIASSEGRNWEYPSPQQFYNALVRKGWETPEEHVEMMVMVHNFLNERAWQEVLDWEREMGVDPAEIALARFQGRPGTLSPKARLFSWAAMVAPSKFNSEPPFDRHDWVVRRSGGSPSEPGKEVRYVIDYYSAPDDPDTAEPVFHLDVRPALDSFEAAQARVRRTWQEWRSQQPQQL